MNTAGLSHLGAKAKPLAEAIARWCEQEGVAYEFSPIRGKHPSVTLSLNRQSRKVFFSGSASDRRTIENVIQNVRKECRTMGWEPRKEVAMEAPVVKSLGDLPKLADLLPEPHSVEVQLPKQDACPPKVGKNKFDPAYRAACKKRNEWVFNRFEDGWDAERIFRAFNAAGWEAKSSQNMYACAKFHRSEIGTTRHSADGKPAPRHEPEIERRATAETQTTIDPLVLAIAEAIAPLIRDQLAKQSKALEALKAKADKWDAISGLVREA